mmetsp:Transcript_15112/g.23914  ORF Transcript_15112/g.23914 Transcript_15112/m.23914 type:complete len:108 (-) Transcript_15112:358-681(-)
MYTVEINVIAAKILEFSFTRVATCQNFDSEIRKSSTLTLFRNPEAGVLRFRRHFRFRCHIGMWGDLRILSSGRNIALSVLFSVFSRLSNPLKLLLYKMHSLEIRSVQ